MQETQSSTSGLWNDFIDPETGEHSLKEHTTKTVKVWCPLGECVFSHNMDDYRKITCKNCGQEKHFIVGYQTLKNGKLIALPVK